MDRIPFDMNRSDCDKELITEMNRYYEARAPRHDDFMSYTTNAAMEALLKPIIEIVEQEVSDRRALEIACGTGNWTQVLAKRAESVVAFDSSQTALALAKSKLTEYGNVTLIERDAYDLSDISDSFELIFSADWWSHIPKATIPHFLESTSTKLAPGAKVIVIDMSSNDYFEKEPSYVDQDGNRVSIRPLDDGREYRVIKNFPTEAELRTMLAPVGKEFTYYHFAELMRWMVVYSNK